MILLQTSQLEEYSWIQPVRACSIFSLVNKNKNKTGLQILKPKKKILTLLDIKLTK